MQAFTHPRKTVPQFDLEPGMHVADLGAGAGHVTLELARHVGSGGRVYAIDIQKPLVSKISREAQAADLPHVEVIWTDLERPRGSQLADQVMDAVVASNVLFQIKQHQTFIEEAARILKNSGKLYVIDWTDSHGGLGPHHQQVISAEKAKDICGTHGFRVEREFTVGNHHYGLVFTTV